jgi:MATE family multidrug resistance protein
MASIMALNLLLVPDVLGLGFDGAIAAAWATLFAPGRRWRCS